MNENIFKMCEVWARNFRKTITCFKLNSKLKAHVFQNYKPLINLNSLKL